MSCAFAGTDRGVVADDIGLDTTPLNLTQLQGPLGLRALHASADGRAATDDIRLGTLPLHLALQLQGLPGVRANWQALIAAL